MYDRRSSAAREVGRVRAPGRDARDERHVMRAPEWRMDNDDEVKYEGVLREDERARGFEDDGEIDAREYRNLRARRTDYGEDDDAREYDAREYRNLRSRRSDYGEDDDAREYRNLRSQRSDYDDGNDAREYRNPRLQRSDYVEDDDAREYRNPRSRRADYDEGNDNREYRNPRSKRAGYDEDTAAAHEPLPNGNSPVFGGPAHDNIPAADARPPMSRMPLLIMLGILLLLAVLALALSGRNRVPVSQSHPVVYVTAVAGYATAAPTQAPSPSPAPTAEGLMLSGYTGRELYANKPAVALTFDDGPSDQTARILDVLEQNGALATFFMVGERVGSYAPTAKRAYDMGCLMGTHLYSHQKLTEMDAQQIAQELELCKAAHQAAFGAEPQLARTPYGSVNATVSETLGMPLINWSLDSRDWETRDADRIFNDVMNNISDGDIVLFHDLKDFSANAIARIVPALKEQGYQVVTVQELFEIKGQALEPGVLYDSRVISARRGAAEEQ